MYMYTWFCILRILLKQTEENMYVNVYRVPYSQYLLETERRKHNCTCILGSVFSVFSGNRQKKKDMYMYTGFYILSIFWKQKEENIDVHVY